MKIKSVELINFKRFTHLVIENIPETAKLVVLLGPNGCGKSSVFDALHLFSLQLSGNGSHREEGYYVKESQFSQGNTVIRNDIIIGFDKAEKSTSDIYVRTAHRNESNLSLDVIERLVSPLEEKRFMKMNQDNPQISRNFQRLALSALRKFHGDSGEGKLLETAQREFFGDLRDSMKYLFEDLTLSSLENFTFNKGISKDFIIQNLSSGEMAAFDLILDMFVKREVYNNTVFCIDEPESHISPRIQGKLLEALLKLLNEKSQLWIATHAIGMMRKAIELDKNSDCEVVFLDFGNRDFDTYQKIEPATPNRNFWEQMHKIALDDLSELVTPNRIILCEGNAGEHGFDAECYNRIFSNEFPDTKFISAGGHRQLNKQMAVIRAVSKGAEVFSLRDRDNLTDSEITEHRQQDIKVLTRGSIEHYLLSDEVLQLLCDNPPDGVDTPAGGAKLLSQIRDNEQHIKGAAMKIHQKRSEWGATRVGSDKNAFLRDILAPLIKSDTTTYGELKRIIFGNGQ